MALSCVPAVRNEVALQGGHTVAPPGREIKSAGCWLHNVTVVLISQYMAHIGIHLFVPMGRIMMLICKRENVYNVYVYSV